MKGEGQRSRPAPPGADGVELRVSLKDPPPNLLVQCPKFKESCDEFMFGVEHKLRQRPLLFKIEHRFFLKESQTEIDSYPYCLITPYTVWHKMFSKLTLLQKKDVIF